MFFVAVSLTIRVGKMTLHAAFDLASMISNVAGTGGSTSSNAQNNAGLASASDDVDINI